jgi:hypothetical protein
MADRMHPQRGPRKRDARSGSSGHGPFGINMKAIGVRAVTGEIALGCARPYLLVAEDTDDREDGTC